MPVKIHSVLQFPITPPKFLKPAKRCFFGNRQLSNPLLRENCLDVWTGDDFHKVLGLQETFLCFLLHLCLYFRCDVFIINNCASFSVQLVEREVPPLYEPHHPFTDVSCMVCSVSLSLGYNF